MLLRAKRYRGLPFPSAKSSIAGKDFLAEAAGVLKAGWITVDDTGARYKGMNGACTHIGNTDFAWFTTRAKSRLNFLALLRAGATDYVINDEALAYMRGRSLSGLVIARLAGHKSKRLKDQEAWMAHLERLGITRLRVHPDPLKIATEGALWGSVVAHGLLKDAVLTRMANQGNTFGPRWVMKVPHDPTPRRKRELPRRTNFIY